MSFGERHPIIATVALIAALIFMTVLGYGFLTGLNAKCAEFKAHGRDVCEER